MNSIEISINSIGNNIDIFIDAKNSIIKINNIEKNIQKEDINALLRIIRTGEPNYYNLNIIDGENFLIKINTEEGTDTIKGKGNYPENYIEFKTWIGEHYD